MLRFLRVLLFFSLATYCPAGTIVYLRVHRDALEQHLMNAPPDSALERLHKLRAQFAAAGCTSHDLYEQEVPKQTIPNLICKMPGKEAGNIVISAPLDKIAGVSEDQTHWATLALLPLLAESVGYTPHRFSIMFVAFSGQQHGLRGSSEYLRQLTPAQRREIRAMINLEDIGRTPLVYAPAQEDLQLVNWLTLSATTLHESGIPMKIDPRTFEAPLTNGESALRVDDYLLDAKTFQHDRIPSISLRSAPYPMIPALRQAGGWVGGPSGKSFDLDIYEETYNVLSVYLLYLDGNLNGPTVSGPQVAVASMGSDSGLTNSPLPDRPAAAENPATRGTVRTTSTSTDSVRTPVTARSEIPVFHAEANLVNMDVSVNDAHGAPIKGLKASDFTLLENGQPQTISVFEEHGSQAPEASSPEIPLPAGTYSNRVAVSGDSPLNIFLFDLLNTPPQDQAYARAQMLQYLKALPKGKRISIFVLGTHLQMVQGFTDDPEALLKSAERILRQASPLLTTDLQNQQDQGFTEEVGRYAMPSIPSNVPASVAASLSAARTDAQGITGFVSQRTATSARSEAIRDDQRTTMTLDALAAISRTVAAYPGRKNLLWLSGSFKIRIRPSDNSFLDVGNKTTQAAAAVSDLSSTYHYQEAIRNLTTAMSAARVAIYPIDVRGLRTGGVEIGVGAESTVSMVDMGNNDAYTKTLNNQSETRFGERSSMLDLAEQTGGHVFLDNDIRGSIAHSLDAGSHYYTLAFTPNKNNSDTSFRHVQIKLNHGSATLAYRPGYFPNPTADSLKQTAGHMLAAAMQTVAPQSTMLLITVRLLPPDSTTKALRIDYRIDLKGVGFEDAADDQKRAVLDCMAVALDNKGNIAGQIANTMDASLRLSELAAFQRTGLPMHQELVLPPGSYDLRIGVLDRDSQRIGTVNVPVQISGETKTN